jgi:hypothetical protein
MPDNQSSVVSTQWSMISKSYNGDDTKEGPVVSIQSSARARRKG